MPVKSYLFTVNGEHICIEWNQGLAQDCWRA